MIKAVLFDVDGTLLDTAEFILHAFGKTIATYKLTPVPRATLLTLIGPPLTEIYGRLAPNLDTSMLVETHRSLQEKNLHLSKPFDKTVETLETLHKKGIKMAAVTNRTKRTSHDTMKLAQIHHFFDIIISAEDVAIEKPHPEGILKVLSHFQIEPEHALMVGDTHVDIGAARAANVKVVGTTQGMKGKDVLKYNPDYVINDISELLIVIEELR